jgi:hypothetical protein
MHQQLGPIVTAASSDPWAEVYKYLGGEIPLAALLRAPWRCLLAIQTTGSEAHGNAGYAGTPAHL